MTVATSPKSPLIIIAGFLGSGKTTFLRKVIKELAQRGIPTGVIINDFENAEADASLLRLECSVERPAIQSIHGSCICCESLDAFLEAVETIPIPPGGVLLIEGNGTTDTVEMITALTMRPQVRNRFWSPIQVTMVDAVRWGMRGEQNALEREQLSTSTHYLVTRQDLVSAGEATQVKLRAALGAPRALETTPTMLAEEMARIIEEDHQPGRVALSTRPRRDRQRIFSPLHSGHAHRHHHRGGRAFTSMSFQLERPLWKTELIGMLEKLPEEVLRVKGLVRLKDDPAVPYSFQHVRPVAETTLIRMDGFDEILAVFQIPRVPMTAIIIGVNLPSDAIHELIDPLTSEDVKSLAS